MKYFVYTIGKTFHNKSQQCEEVSFSDYMTYVGLGVKHYHPDYHALLVHLG